MNRTTDFNINNNLVSMISLDLYASSKYFNSHE